MVKKSNKRARNDFVAKDNKHNIICVSGRDDSFTAIWSNGEWKTDYPIFDDLMDHFFEVKDLLEIQKISSEARKSLLNVLQMEIGNNPAKRKPSIKSHACPRKPKVSKRIYLIFSNKAALNF